MSKSQSARVFVFDLMHLYDRIEGLDIELCEADRLIGYYLESRFKKSGYLVIKPSQPFSSLTNPYYKYIEEKLNKCRLLSMINPSSIPSHIRENECHMAVRDYSLFVVFP